MAHRSTGKGPAEEAGEVVRLAEKIVKRHMAKYDPSHDWAHVERVRRTALKIARTIEPAPDALVVELAALFHDMADAKYDPNASISSLLQPFFSDSVSASLLPAQRDLVLRIVPSVSWSTEKKLRQANAWTQWHDECSELHAVQDADRLDAVGAVGVMRCAAFSAVTGRTLLNDEGGTDTAEGHFADKLLLIRDRMKTPWGREEADRRHETMVHFLAQVERERSSTQ